MNNSNNNNKYICNQNKFNSNYNRNFYKHNQQCKTSINIS